MNTIKAYLVDAGVLLPKEHPEFSFFSTVYDKKYGYFDEMQYYEKDKQDAIKIAKSYVEKGVKNTYAIVKVSEVDEDYDFDENLLEERDYLVEDVIYSAANINGKIVENFLDKE